MSGEVILYIINEVSRMFLRVMGSATLILMAKNFPQRHFRQNDYKTSQLWRNVEALRIYRFPKKNFRGNKKLAAANSRSSGSKLYKHKELWREFHL